MLSDDDASEAMVPFGVKSLKATQAGEGPVWWCHATLVGELRWDIRLSDAAGQVVVEIEGFETAKGAAPDLPAATDGRSGCIAWSGSRSR